MQDSGQGDERQAELAAPATSANAEAAAGAAGSSTGEAETAESQTPFLLFGADRALGRVWLPDAVLPAGEKLVTALQGDGKVNFTHLQRRYPGAALKINGEASLAIPQDKRLHISILCTERSTLDSVTAEVKDLAETAIDLVADTLGFSEDQLQLAFEAVRVKKYVFSAVRCDDDDEEDDDPAPARGNAGASPADASGKAQETKSLEAVQNAHSSRDNGTVVVDQDVAEDVDEEEEKEKAKGSEEEAVQDAGDDAKEEKALRSLGKAGSSARSEKGDHETSAKVALTLPLKEAPSPEMLQKGSKEAQGVMLKLSKSSMLSYISVQPEAPQGLQVTVAEMLAGGRSPDWIVGTLKARGFTLEEALSALKALALARIQAAPVKADLGVVEDSDDEGKSGPAQTGSEDKQRMDDPPLASSQEQEASQDIDTYIEGVADWLSKHKAQEPKQRSSGPAARGKLTPEAIVHTLRDRGFTPAEVLAKLKTLGLGQRPAAHMPPAPLQDGRSREERPPQAPAIITSMMDEEQPVIQRSVPNTLRMASKFAPAPKKGASVLESKFAPAPKKVASVPGQTGSWIAAEMQPPLQNAGAAHVDGEHHVLQSAIETPTAELAREATRQHQYERSVTAATGSLTAPTAATATVEAPVAAAVSKAASVAARPLAAPATIAPAAATVPTAAPAAPMAMIQSASPSWADLQAWLFIQSQAAMSQMALQCGFGQVVAAHAVQPPAVPAALSALGTSTWPSAVGTAAGATSSSSSSSAGATSAPTAPLAQIQMQQQIDITLRTAVKKEADSEFNQAFANAWRGSQVKSENTSDFDNAFKSAWGKTLEKSTSSTDVAADPSASTAVNAAEAPKDVGAPVVTQPVAREIMALQKREKKLQQEAEEKARQIQNAVKSIKQELRETTAEAPLAVGIQRSEADRGDATKACQTPPRPSDDDREQRKAAMKERVEQMQRTAKQHIQAKHQIGELLQVLDDASWHALKSTWVIPTPPRNASGMLTCGPGGKPRRLRAFLGSRELQSIELRQPCVLLGSQLTSAHVADLSDESVQSQHAALLWTASGHFSLQPIRGPVRVSAISAHPLVVRALGQQLHRHPAGDGDRVLELPVGSGRQTLYSHRCCFQLASSRLVFVVDLFDSTADDERKKSPQRFMQEEVERRRRHRSSSSSCGRARLRKRSRSKPRAKAVADERSRFPGSRRVKVEERSPSPCARRREGREVRDTGRHKLQRSRSRELRKVRARSSSRAARRSNSRRRRAQRSRSRSANRERKAQRSRSKSGSRERKAQKRRAAADKAQEMMKKKVKVEARSRSRSTKRTERKPSTEPRKSSPAKASRKEASTDANIKNMQDRVADLLSDLKSRTARKDSQVETPARGSDDTKPDASRLKDKIQRLIVKAKTEIDSDHENKEKKKEKKKKKNTKDAKEKEKKSRRKVKSEAESNSQEGSKSAVEDSGKDNSPEKRPARRRSRSSS